jgi:hypothetical protein
MRKLKARALQNLRKYVMITAIKRHSLFFPQLAVRNLWNWIWSLKLLNKTFGKLATETKFLQNSSGWFTGPYSSEGFVDIPRKFLCVLVFSPVLFITTGRFDPATPWVSLWSFLCFLFHLSHIPSPDTRDFVSPAAHSPRDTTSTFVSRDRKVLARPPGAIRHVASWWNESCVLKIEAEQHGNSVAVQ